MDTLIQAYIQDHQKAWSPSTLRSEKHRLHAVSAVLDGNPDALWAELERKGAKPYSRVTTWTRVISFWSWLIRTGQKSGPNPYEEWREKNALQFKHVYERRQPAVSYREARERIETIQDGEIREKCLQLLRGGLRYSESFTVDDQGFVTGKGGKRRRVYAGRTEYRKSYATLVRRLQRLGLRPHDLRKLAATEFRRRGLNEETLCKVMGWESFETAKAYLQPMKDEEIEKLITA